MWLLGLFLLIAPLISSCTHLPNETRSFTLLAMNDIYRIDGVDDGTSGGLARVRGLRAELEKADPNVLLLHAGDFLFPSLLSRQYHGQQMIDVLNLLDGNPDTYDHRLFVTFGNHEFEKSQVDDATLVDARIEESQFAWLGSNIVFKKSETGQPLVESDNLTNHTMIYSGDVQIGLFSLTADIKHPAYVAEFGKPESVARHLTRQLRDQGADFVIAITHQPMSQDSALLDTLRADGPDLIIGGHEHNRQSLQVNGRWVLKADADARTATVIRVTLPHGGPPTVYWKFQKLHSPTVEPDPLVQARIDHWIRRHDEDYCQSVLKHPPGCLDKVLGKTQVRLTGEELEIRRYETNLGNWIADQALLAFADQGAQVAFINSGSLRLNQDIPAGTPITRRHIEQLFAYPTPLKLLRMNGATLQKAISHAVEDWTGNGWWLQVSGLAFSHDPQTESADNFTLLTTEGPQSIHPDDQLVIVTNSFLAEGGDGYSMLSSTSVLNTAQAPDLKEFVIQRLKTTNIDGILPKVEGRICNSIRDGPCQAIMP
ncbi:MAG: hypothetical protein GKS05_05280 [Nitrospirales bacterium]|nr:hypothetical protein [Nitrospirales bacterium]